jgi:hypothetical protein
MAQAARKQWQMLVKFWEVIHDAMEEVLRSSSVSPAVVFSNDRA